MSWIPAMLSIVNLCVTLIPDRQPPAVWACSWCTCSACADHDFCYIWLSNLHAYTACMSWYSSGIHIYNLPKRKLIRSNASHFNFCWYSCRSRSFHAKHVECIKGDPTYNANWAITVIIRLLYSQYLTQILTFLTPCSQTSSITTVSLVPCVGDNL